MSGGLREPRLEVVETNEVIRIVPDTPTNLVFKRYVFGNGGELYLCGSLGKPSMSLGSIDANPSGQPL